MDAVFDYNINLINAVVAVEGTSKLSKDRKQRETRQQDRRKGSAFAKTLHSAIGGEAPAQFKTVVYGRNGQVFATNYQTREY